MCLVYIILFIFAILVPPVFPFFLFVAVILMFLGSNDIGKKEL